jgi:hypothetical protein
MRGLPHSSNGNDLSGFNGLPEVWRVEQGMLTATTPAGKKAHATFLVSPQNYRDFELRFQARVEGGQGGGGVIVRGLRSNNPVLPQGPLIKVGDAWDWGHLTWEASGNPRIPMTQEIQNAVAARVSKDGFHDFAVKCQGKRIVITVNGYTTVDQIWEPLPDEGPIAFQIHFGRGTKGVQFRNVRLRELKPANTADGRPLFNGKDLNGLDRQVAEWVLKVGGRTRLARGNHIVVLLNGKKVVDFIDKSSLGPFRGDVFHAASPATA